MRAGRLRGWLAFICLTSILCITLSLSQAQTQTQDGSGQSAPERAVKAAFLYKFAGYVDWPTGTFARADTPLTIAVMGDDQFADVLAEYVTGRTVDERPISVKKQKDDGVAEGINIVFIARGDKTGLRTAANSPRPVLIVTESDGALAQGSAINFVVSGGRVRFEASTENAEKRRLKLASGLLRVALNTRATPP
ncbi:MAG: hypothetical protein JWN94_527 [Betaproteobacteria bacterium]|nr:hypothetical protein [Betaproteobacteria bacterium]